ncbi:MAG: NAD(P)H-hydrate dehydratase [Elusimicrobiota bacterium]
MKHFSLKSLRRWLPPRPREAHKGDFGHVLIIAGSRGMTGAAVLAARGALRSGCGLATVAVPESQQPVVAGHLAEAMTLPLPETTGGAIRADAVGRLLASHQKRDYTVLAIGPGLGTGSETARAVVGALGSLRIPAVIDADAINILALNSRGAVRTLLERRGAPYIFTPHPGEISRLLRSKTASVMADREAAARLLCSELGGVCLLKGRGSLVTDGRRLWRNPTGNPGLAKGGSGDALTGIVTGIWSQRLLMPSTPGSRGQGDAELMSGNAPGPGRPDQVRRSEPAFLTDDGFEAAALGAYLHGFSADRAAKDKTTRALLASDVIEALPAAFIKLGG